MSEIQISNGSVVEDTLTNETEASITPEAYATIRYIRNEQANLRDKIRDTQREERDDDSYTLPEDSDVVQYHKFLKSFKVEGESLGKLQRVACKYRGDDYFANHNLGEAIDFAPANDVEQQIADRLFSERNNRDKATTKHFDNHMVPLTPDKEEIPLYVTSNDRNEGTHTLEEAKEIWESFKAIIPIESTGEPIESDDEQDEEPTDDGGSSDQDEDYLLGGANGVGEEVSSDIRDFIVNNRVTVDWREHIDAESDSWRESVVTDEEAEKRVTDLYGEIPEGVYTVAKQEVEDGNTEKALMLIEDFE